MITVTAARAGDHDLYIRHPFTETAPGSGVCSFTELDDDGAELRCRRPYGEHLPTEGR